MRSVVARGTFVVRPLIALSLAIAMVAIGAPPADADFGFKDKFGKNGGVGTLGSADGELLAPGGSAVAPNGQIYVLEQEGCDVRIFEPDGDFVRRWGGPCGGMFDTDTELLFRPVEIAIALNGDVYITDWYQGRIKIYDSFGNHLRNIGGAPLDPDVQLYGVQGIALTPLSATPDIFVVDGYNHRVTKFNNAGDFQWTRGRDVLSTDGDTGSEYCAVAADCKVGVVGTGDGQFNFSVGLDIDATGTQLFVADRSNNRVQKLSATDGSFVSSIATASPTGVASVHSTGELWVTALLGSRVLQYDASGTSLGQIGPGGNEGDYDFGLVGHPAATATGGVVVPDSELHRVQVYDSNRSHLASLGKNGGGTNKGSATGEFSNPQGLAVGDGKLWVVDMNNSRVQRLTTAGVYELSIPGSGVVVGTEGGKFYNPTSVEVQPVTDDIWVSDGMNHRIQRFSKGGVFKSAYGYDVLAGAPADPGEVCSTANLCKTGTSGNALGQFNYPIDIGFSPDGSIAYVVEQNNNRIQRINTTTMTAIDSVGVYGSGNGQFSNPQAIEVRPDGSYYVSEYSNQRVQLFDDTNTFVAKTSVGGYPSGLAVMNNGDLHVVQSGSDRVQVLVGDLGTSLGNYGLTGSANGQFYQPWKIAHDPDTDDVYVSDAGNNRIQRFGDTTVDPPLLTINAPTNNHTTYAATVTLDYDATDQFGDPATCSPGNHTIISLPDLDVPKTITVTCQNPFGSPVTSDVTVTRISDVTPPVVTITSPAEGATLTSNQVAVNYTASDDFGPAPSCDISDGQLVPLVTGPNTIQVNCTDGSSNVGTGTVNVTYVAPASPAVPAKLAIGVKVAKIKRFNGSIRLTVNCSAACELTGSASIKSGKKRLRAKGKATSSRPGAVKLKLKFSKKSTRQIKRLIAAGKRPRVKLTVSGGNAAGSAKPIEQSLRLRR